MSDTLMTPLRFEVLYGTYFVPTRPQDIRRGAVFRVHHEDGRPYFVMASRLPDFGDRDDGVYVAAENGGEDGVSISVFPVIWTEMVPAHLPPEA